MKQAKFALTAVTLLAVIGGALAFKASRFPSNFYRYTTSIVNGQKTGICDQNLVVQILAATVSMGGTITTVSAAPNTIGTTTCTARVINAL